MSKIRKNQVSTILTDSGSRGSAEQGVLKMSKIRKNQVSAIVTDSAAADGLFSLTVRYSIMESNNT